MSAQLKQLIRPFDIIFCMPDIHPFGKIVKLSERRKMKVMFSKQIIGFLLCCPLQMLCSADPSLFKEEEDSQEIFQPLPKAEKLLQQATTFQKIF